jgi:tripeptidyl-peptidase-1
MHFFQLSSVLLLAAVSYAVPTPSTHVLHEKREISELWVKGVRLNGEVKLPMRIGLTQSNLGQGHDMLMRVAHPDSPHFGKHLSVDEVTDLFAPAEDAVSMARGRWHRIQSSFSVNEQAVAAI